MYVLNTPNILTGLKRLKENVICTMDDVQGDFLGLPHSTTLAAVKANIMTLRQKLPSYGKVDITIYECTCNMLICEGILLKFQQHTRFEMRNPIKIELIFCCVAFKHGTDFRGDGL